MTKAPYRPFKSVLVANRGEIAARIVREAQALGLHAVAVFSDADRNAPHAKRADSAVHIGASTASESYLNVERILAAAKASGAEAVHPGYGFLSENADFAQAVADAGLVWIGPSSEAIRALGDKGRAKHIAREAGVPVIPGYDESDQSDARLASEAARIGWPVMIKAAAGGGGRGMRRVERADDFAGALASARREAKSAFGSDHMILERALDGVRHVEVQIMADAHGAVRHLAERDCSVQRRNQKIIEEAPSPAVSAALRARMGEAAIKLCRAVGYTNAGTVEFLLDAHDNFYFLEMNTRIQVEHPVTEEVLGLNLIALQLRIASGAEIGVAQEACVPRGHSIQVRLCAEDPHDNFKPQVGRIAALHTDGTTRFDSGIAEGLEVSPFYDSMLGKLIATGASRDEARRALIRALRELVVLGVTTNKAYLLALLNDPVFADGKATTGWLGGRPSTATTFDEELAAPVALWLAHGEGASWSSTGARRTIVTLKCGETAKTYAVEANGLGGLSVVSVVTAANGAALVSFGRGDVRFDAWLSRGNDRIDIDCGGRTASFEDATYTPAERKGAAGDGAVRAPMAGKIVAVHADVGAKVAKGAIVVVLEAMKMEHELRAAADGVVEAVNAKAGDQVAMRQVLVTLKPV